MAAAGFSAVRKLLQNPGFRMLLIPFSPVRVVKGNCREQAVNELSLNAYQTFSFRIPERFRLFVIQHKRVVICPP